MNRCCCPVQASVVEKTVLWVFSTLESPSLWLSQSLVALSEQAPFHRQAPPFGAHDWNHQAGHAPFSSSLTYVSFSALCHSADFWRVYHQKVESTTDMGLLPQPRQTHTESETRSLFFDKAICTPEDRFAGERKRIFIHEDDQFLLASPNQSWLKESQISLVKPLTKRGHLCWRRKLPLFMFEGVSSLFRHLL